MTHVAVLIRSLRKASLNRKVTHALIGLAPADMALELDQAPDRAALRCVVAGVSLLDRRALSW